jgi:predicted nucleotidyltransferase
VNRIERAAEHVRLLESLGHRCALVGGLAVATRARDRFTKDIDFAVSVDSDATAEQVVYQLRLSGLGLSDTFDQEATGRLATARFIDPVTSTREPTLDILFASSGIEPEIVADATLVPIVPNVALPVATIPHLVATKVLAENAVRTHDREDLRALLRVASDEQVERARELVLLIDERGFGRDKNLPALLDTFVRQYRTH